jgi:hypothetical protein
MIGLAQDYEDPGIPTELTFWYGPKFNDSLMSISSGVSVYEATDIQKVAFNILRTEFWWKTMKPKSEHYVFEAEELIDLGRASKYECRFVHSMVDVKTGMVSHLDGAIRAYTQEQMDMRRSTSIDEPGGKHTEYTKLWRIDGEIDVVTWKELVAHYYRDNVLVGEYLNAGRENVDPIEQDNKPQESNNPIPYSMIPGMGLRIAVHCRHTNKGIVASPYTHHILGRRYGGYANPVIESKSLDIHKILSTLGGKIELLKNLHLIQYEDGYINFPVILHNAEDLFQNLSLTQSAMRKVIAHWIAQVADIVICYSLGFKIEDRLVLVSILGHIQDINTWLEHPLSAIPVTKGSLAQWINDMARYVEEHGSKEEDTPLWADVLTEEGLLYITRETLDKEEYDYDSKDLLDSLPHERPNISAARSFLIDKMTCTRCGESYIQCLCSCLLDNDVASHIDSYRRLAPIWTDRPQ